MKSYNAKLDKTIYSKEALLKAAYFFVKDYYIHLDQDEKYYSILIFAKGPGGLSANILIAFAVPYGIQLRFLNKNQSDAGYDNAIRHYFS